MSVKVFVSEYDNISSAAKGHAASREAYGADAKGKPVDAR